MSPSDPLPEFGLSWRMREHEARLLADSLRSSRLTLLYASAGASRSALLSEGVVPLLARREADAAADARLESRVVEPFVDRREGEGRESQGAVRTERVVYFSEWSGDPLPALLAVIRAAIPAEVANADPDGHFADVLEAICERLDARILVVLDAFERFVAAASGSAEADRFVAALAEAVDRPRLRVNFLLAVDDRWEGRLDALRRAVRGFDDSTIRLLGLERGDAAAVPPDRSRVARSRPPALAASLPPPTLSDAVETILPLLASPDLQIPPPPRARRPRPPKVPVAPPVPIKADGVYAFIESTLTQTADASEPWHDVDAPPPAASASGSASTTDPFRRPRGPLDDATRRSLAAAEPPNPIDEWLDSAIAWCRRLLWPR